MPKLNKTCHPANHPPAMAVGRPKARDISLTTLLGTPLVRPSRKSGDIIVPRDEQTDDTDMVNVGADDTWSFKIKHYIIADLI